MMRSLAVWVLGIAFAGNAAAADDAKQHAQRSADPVVYSFVFMGCNRLDRDASKATKSSSTANEIQLRQDFAEIAALQPVPQLVFFAGDIVMGMAAGTRDLKKQLPRWAELVTRNNPLDLSATRLIAFTGNHEVLKKLDTVRKIEVPNQPAYALWVSVMSPRPAARTGYDFIAGSNGPTNALPNPDRLLNDERRLSYTFQSGGNLFVILNTDTQIDATTTGNIPLQWVTAQLHNAQVNASVRHVFVMGHRPILSPEPGNPGIRDGQAADFYARLNDPAGNGSPTKVRAYLGAHAHEWKYDAALSFPGGIAGKIPQVVAGNAGSPPNGNWRGDDAYFGYTLVSVMRGGTITVQSFGRRIPAPYYLQEAAPATVRATHVIYSPPAKKP